MAKFASMKLRLFAFVILCFALTSCQQIIDNYWDRKEEENFTSSYMGVYKGNYSGDETGYTNHGGLG